MSTDVPLLAPDAVMAQARHENFPVAVRLLPTAVRRHLLSLYGFARLADDIGDEAPGNRLAQLDWLAAELRRAVAGDSSHPLLRPVGVSIRELDLPLQAFDDLLEANRRDQAAVRYERLDDLVAYCMLSAAPVGRLVLAVWGLATPERIALSDDVCIGLQLAEHIQDVGEDARRGRVYLPWADLRSEGCGPNDLVAPSAAAPLRRVIGREVEQARRFLGAGPALASTLPGRARLALAGFVGGGLAALDAVAGAECDVLARACRPSRAGVARRAAQVLLAARASRPAPRPAAVAGR